MAAYADQQFAIDCYGLEYVTVSCDRNRDGTIDSAAFALALDIATAKINSALLGRVPLPLAEVPLDVKIYCVDLAIYDMCPSASVRTEEKTKRYDAAQSWLKRVADNKIKLAIGGSAAPAPAAGPHLTASPETVESVAQIDEIREGARDYTRESLKGLL